MSINWVGAHSSTPPLPKGLTGGSAEVTLAASGRKAGTNKSVSWQSLRRIKSSSFPGLQLVTMLLLHFLKLYTHAPCYRCCCICQLLSCEFTMCNSFTRPNPEGYAQAVCLRASATQDGVNSPRLLTPVTLTLLMLLPAHGYKGACAKSCCVITLCV